VKHSFHWAGVVVILIIVSVSFYKTFRDTKSASLCANPGSCTSLPKLDVENGVTGLFEKVPVQPPVIDVNAPISGNRVLGDATSKAEKKIYVNLATQTLTAYEGKSVFLETKVSTGKWNATPTGEYTIWVKLRATRMRGGSGDDAYDLPNVPYVMFFSNATVPKMAGFSLHGAYWHDNFGHMMSHGCVNLRQVDAQKLYDWVTPDTVGTTTYATDADPGTKIIIY
jgi:lipoprotein-anchoring transpeptidase ErfK/SrfK